MCSIWYINFEMHSARSCGKIDEEAEETPNLNATKTGLATLMLTAIVIGATVVPLAAYAVETMDELIDRFELMMSETMDYMDRAWDVAKRFRDPNYDYDPADLGNFTLPEIPVEGGG